MATDKIATIANKLRRDIESRYLCKCSFGGKLCFKWRSTYVPF